MKKKSIFSKVLSCAIAITTVLMAAPAAPAKAAVTWNNTANVSWIDSSKKIIAFAFDDGPARGNTGTSILNTLEKYKMHATFFYQGNQMTYSNKAEIKRAYDLGCEVASHTYSHPYLTNLSYSQIQNEVNKNANLLKEITGQSKYLIRPPYLATNANVFNAIDVPLVTCSLDTSDWAGASKDAIIQKVLNNAKDGDILLMHETYTTTAQAVEYLVPELIRRGFVITSVSELFKMKGQTMTSGRVYTSCPGRNVVTNTPNNNNNNTTNNNNNNNNNTNTNPVPGNTANLKDGWYYIKNVNAQKYLQVANNVGQNAQNIELGRGTGVAGQKWYLKNVGNGYITLQSALGNFMIDIANGNNTDGANTQIYASHSGTAQQFMLKSSATNGAYIIATKCSNLTKALDAYNFGTSDGTNVCQWTYGGKNNQQWIFEAVNGGSSSNTSSNTGSGSTTNSNTNSNQGTTTLPTTPPSNTVPTDKLALDYSISNWGSAYQVNFKVSNKSTAAVNTWTLKIKKSEINIGTSWNINVKVDGDYYVITPMSFNSYLAPGTSTEFGIQGSGSIGTTLNYVLN